MVLKNLFTKLKTNHRGNGGEEINEFRINRYTFSSIQFSSVAQSCLTLCDPIDGSPPGSPVPGILQARTLEWVAISFSNAGK